MAKTIRDEDLRLNIIINGDNGRKQMGELAKIYFQTPSHSKHEYLRSKQLPTKSHSAEPPLLVLYSRLSGLIE